MSATAQAPNGCPLCGGSTWGTVGYRGAMGARYVYSTCVTCGYVTDPRLVEAVFCEPGEGRFRVCREQFCIGHDS